MSNSNRHLEKFYDEKGREYCVNEYKDLFDKIVEFCVEYFKEKGIERKDE